MHRKMTDGLKLWDFYKDIRSDRKKSTHTFLSITQIWIALVKNHSNQQKVHILRIPNW